MNRPRKISRERHDLLFSVGRSFTPPAVPPFYTTIPGRAAMLPLEYKDVELSSPEPSPCPSPALTEHASSRGDDDDDDDDRAPFGSPSLPAPDPPTSPRPTWPDPSAIKISTTYSPKTPSAGAARRRSARSGGLIGKFEVK